MPGPHFVGSHALASVDTANGFTVDVRMSCTCATVRSGATLSISATVPDTIGAAKLVPPPMK